MWALLLPVLLSLLQQIVPALGPLFVAVIKNLTAKLNEGADMAVMVADETVSQIAANPANSEKTNEEKRQMAFDAIKESQPDISDSMANVLIELAVQRLKEAA